jgi:hypothetical protein
MQVRILPAGPASGGVTGSAHTNGEALVARPAFKKYLLCGSKEGDFSQLICKLIQPEITQNHHALLPAGCRRPAFLRPVTSPFGPTRAACCSGIFCKWSLPIEKSQPEKRLKIKDAAH